MIKYHLEITGEAEKELRKYHAKLQDRINDASRTVKILDVGHRKDIYR